MQRLLFLLVFLLSSHVASADFPAIREDLDSWECTDYVLDFCTNNSSYIPCSMSYWPNFRMSHMVAVRAIDNETIEIYDVAKDGLYEFHGWRDSDLYFHFWIDSTPWRNWGYLRDNSEVLR